MILHSRVRGHILPFLILPVIIFAQDTLAEHWTLYTAINKITDLERDGETVWAGTTGGLVRWNSRNRSYKAFTVAEGLPANLIYSVVRRSDGMLWLSTINGICLFDPNTESCTIVSTDIDEQSLRISTVDPFGGFWFIVGEGLKLNHYTVDGTITYTTADFDTRSTHFCQVMSDHAGAVWVVTDSLVHISNGETWDTLDIVSQLSREAPCIRLYFADDNTPYVITKKEIGWLDDSKYHYIVDNPTVYTTSMSIKSTDDIWLGGYGSRVYRYDGTDWAFIRLEVSPGCIDFVDDTILTESGEIWAATRSGIFILDKSVNDVCEHLYPEYGPQSNFISDFEISETGELWCITNAYGISRFDGNTWDITWDKHINGILCVGKITCSKDGTVWYVEYIHNAKYYNGNSWEEASELPGWPHTDFGSSIGDISAGDYLWIARDDTLFRYDGEHMKRYTSEDGLPRGSLKTVAVDHDGAVWAVGDWSISRWDGYGWTSWDVPSYMDGSIMEIAPDRRGNVWLRTERSLLYFDLGTGRFSEKEIPEGASPWTKGIVCDSWERLWFGLESGVAVYDSDHWRYISLLGRDIGDIDATVRVLSFDNYGDLWIGTESGLYRYTPDPGGPVNVEQEPTPCNLALTNYPNPFNPSTAIEFTLPSNVHTTLTIYNLTGQKMRTLVDETMSAGRHIIVWDGLDEERNAVAAGIYIILLEASEMTAAGKMVLVH